MLVASAAANEMLSRDEVEREHQVYVMDEDDAENVATPASRLLSRRMRDDGIVNPDLADAISALVALAAYIAKVFHRRTALRRARAEAATPPAGDPSYPPAA